MSVSSGLVPISGNSRSITIRPSDSGFSNGPVPTPGSIYPTTTQAYNGYGYTAPIGYNHRGIDDVTRINMSLKSGIESEIKWALSTLCRLSLNPKFNFEHEGGSFLGYELFKYFIKPYQLINDKKYELVTQDVISFSLDSLLSLTNAVQDLHNQQWLSQIKQFKKYLLEALKFLTNWFYQPDFQIPQLKQYHNQFSEALTYLIDLLEPLTCYYVENTRNDHLFHTLLQALMSTTDKDLFVNILNCISHLLIIRDRKIKFIDEGEEQEEEHQAKKHLAEAAAAAEEDEVDERITNNCIDAITSSQLETIVNTLLVADNEMNNAVLEFLKMYLNSEAIHHDFISSPIKDSQKFRLNKLLQLNSTKANFNTLVKQLPRLIVANLPLNDPTSIKPIPQLNLTKRSDFSRVPSTLPDLPPELYKIIIQFPEPLRATTWLRCCYEPFTPLTDPEETLENNDIVIPGEVTQISLWKAYEKQFQEVWDPPSGQTNSEYKQLLPAVEFIKNVSKAFPSSEAMVINLPQVAEEEQQQAPKKKFIIRGIQPRQFAVNIESANYEALKPTQKTSSINPGDNHKLPIGHVDSEKFSHLISESSEKILSEGTRVGKHSESINQITESSHEILEYIINEVLDNTENSTEENIFRLYNFHWLPELVYANPSLVETGIISIGWLKNFNMVNTPNQLPFHVRATDAIHRVTVLGIVTFCVVGTGSILFNIYANSDYAPWNKNKLKFEKEEYHEARPEAESGKQ
ncbi:Chromatin structure-remodeling complex subunit RSC9 [Spathaspora sp. JA1]|nr:Chromatin structure-remodeling complex subunit RSC9 [Spathaspora sp. JA1]